MTVTTLIYCLIDPSTRQVRYIGKTQRTLAQRFKAHLSNARSGRGGRRNRWIRKLLGAGIEPLIKLVEQCDGDGCAEEVHQIALCRADGLRLANNTAGGEGAQGYRHTPSSIRLMSSQRKSRPRKPESIERLKETLKRTGHRPPQWGIEKGAAMRRGKQVTEAERTRLLAITTGRVHSAEEKAKRTAALTLRMNSLTEEQKQQLRGHLSRINKGRVFGAETREKMRQAKVGKSQPWRPTYNEIRFGSIELRKFVASSLRSIRESAGLNQLQLGRLLGFNAVTISATEKGRHIPSLGKLYQMIHAIHCHEKRQSSLLKSAEHL